MTRHCKIWILTANPVKKLAEQNLSPKQSYYIFLAILIFFVFCINCSTVEFMPSTFMLHWTNIVQNATAEVGKVQLQDCTWLQYWPPPLGGGQISGALPPPSLPAYYQKSVTLCRGHRDRRKNWYQGNEQITRAWAQTKKAIWESISDKPLPSSEGSTFRFARF